MELNRCDLCKTNSYNLNQLSCGHQTCSDCFYKLFLENKKLYSIPQDYEITLECLVCSSGTLILKKDDIMKKLKLSIGLERKWDLCAVHRREINIFCAQCKTFMCLECFNNHKVISIFASHEEVLNMNPKLYAPQEKCLIHEDLPYIHYCTVCNCYICEICKFKEHKTHKIKNIKEFYRDRK